MALPCNVGGTDKALRTGLGVGLVAVGYFAPLPALWGIVIYAGAVIALLTAFLNYCPLNQALSRDTCARSEA